MDRKRLIGTRIKELRKKRGLSQEQVAQAANLTAKHLSSIEVGKENPTLDTFLKLADALGVELWELLQYSPMPVGKELRMEVSGAIKNLKEADLQVVMKFLNALMK